MSFQVASSLGGMFLEAAPPASAIEEWVLGLARPAYVYLSEGPLPEDEGDVLVIEIDGKAAPTATARNRRGAVARGLITNRVASVSGIAAGRSGDGGAGGSGGRRGTRARTAAAPRSW